MFSGSEWFALELISEILIPTVVVICGIYHSLKLLSHRYEMFVKKRSLSLIYRLNLSLLLKVASLAVAQYFALRSIESTATLISGVVYFCSLWLCLYFLILKSWFIYYKYHFTYFTIESEWLQLINPKLSSIQNWFIKNNYKYGNVSYMSRMIGIPCIFGAIMCSIGTALSLSYLGNGPYLMLIPSLALATIPLIPATLFYAVIVRKTPLFDDTFQIHWESKIHSKLLLIWCVVFALTNAAVLIDIRGLIFGIPIMHILFFLIVYVSTSVIINKNVQNTDAESIDESSGITLGKILSNQEAIHLFMVHLSKEYSMEILLSLIEITQFQNYIKAQLGTDVKIKSKVSLDPLFPSTIPTSEIMEVQEDVQNICTCGEDERGYVAKIKAYKIYCKYIQVGSEFEINIASFQRHKLAVILQDFDGLIAYNITMEDLYTLFDGAKQEMISLLNYSLGRLRVTPEYANLLLCFNV